MSPTKSRKSPHTQWRRIVGWRPHPGDALPHALVVETLDCGHTGKRSARARVEERIAEGRRRLCKACTDQVRTERVAEDAARRLGGRGYRCKACGLWHLTTGTA
jgi:hypothetical protein